MRAPAPTSLQRVPRLAPGAPTARTDERSWQSGTTKKPSPQLAAGSGYRSSLNKAFTIEIDGVLSPGACPLECQALSPTNLRSLGRGSVNRSNDWTFCACDGGPAGAAPHKLVTVCASGWLTRSVNMDWNVCRAGGGAGSFSPACAKA